MYSKLSGLNIKTYNDHIKLSGLLRFSKTKKGHNERSEENGEPALN